MHKAVKNLTSIVKKGQNRRGGGLQWRVVSSHSLCFRAVSKREHVIDEGELLGGHRGGDEELRGLQQSWLADSKVT